MAMIVTRVMQALSHCVPGIDAGSREGRLATRLARVTCEDRAALACLARRMHAEGGYADLPFDEVKVSAAMQAVLSRPTDHFAAIAEIAGEPVGFLGGK